MHRGRPRSSFAPWAFSLALSSMLAACSDDVAPTDAATDRSPADVTDVTPVTDATDAGDVTDASDASDASDATDAPAPLPRCDWDGGAPSATTLSIGRGVAMSLCNFCHQDSMPGAGDFSGQTFPRPRTTAYGANLTPDRMTGIGARTDEQVLRSIRQSVAADGARRLCEMSPFSPTMLPDENLCALLAYLRSLTPVSRAIPASTCAR
ncbi:MAG: hypothetical protein U0326_02965 [Polyangiales bacterium]